MVKKSKLLKKQIRSEVFNTLRQILLTVIFLIASLSAKDFVNPINAAFDEE